MTEILLETSLRIAIVAALTGLGLTAFRIRQAGLRHLCWTCVLMALIAMPILSAVLPTIALPILPAMSPTEAVVVSSSVTAIADPVPPVSTSTSLPLILGFVYGTVALGLIGRWCLGYFLGLRLVRSAHPSGVQPSLSRARCLESDRVSVPLTFGWIRPVILLPPISRRWSRARLNAVIAHEAAHVRRHDFAIAAAASLARALFWFNPMVWWLEWRLTTLAEQAADDSAVGGSVHDYAEHLVSFASQNNGGRVLGVAAVGRSGLGQRVQRLLDPRYPQMRSCGRLTLGLAVAVLAVLIAVSATIAVGQANVQEPIVDERGQPTDGRSDDDIGTLQAGPKQYEEARSLLQNLIETYPESRPAPLPPAEPNQAEPQSGPFRPGGEVVAPRIIERVQPVLPETGEADGISGRVVLEVLVEADGTVTVLETVVTPENASILADAAAEAVRQWTFEPGTRNGEPVDVRMNLEINFTPRESDPEVFTTGGGVTPPSIRSRVEPEYPEEARRARQEGTVILDAIIRRDGTVEILNVAQSQGFGMDEAAIDALSQWIFNPGKRNGEPVDVRLSIEVNFRP